MSGFRLIAAISDVIIYENIDHIAINVHSALNMV